MRTNIHFATHFKKSKFAHARQTFFYLEFNRMSLTDVNKRLCSIGLHIGPREGLQIRADIVDYKSGHDRLQIRAAFGITNWAEKVRRGFRTCHNLVTAVR